VDSLVSLHDKNQDALKDSVIHWAWHHIHKRFADYPEELFEKTWGRGAYNKKSKSTK